MFGFILSAFVLFASLSGPASAQLNWQTLTEEDKKALAGPWVEVPDGPMPDFKTLKGDCEKPLLTKDIWKTASYYESIHKQYPALETAKGRLIFLEDGEGLVAVESFGLSRDFRKFSKMLTTGWIENAGKTVLQFLESPDKWDDTNAQWKKSNGSTSANNETVTSAAIGPVEHPGGINDVLLYPMAATGATMSSTRMYARCSDIK